MQNVALKSWHTYRELLFAWTMRTIRARYQQSILGGLWAIVQPIAMMIVFTILFTLFLHVDTGGVPYALFSYTAMVPWTFFITSITDMVDSLVANMNLVSKIYFPREILPIAAMLARLLDFGIASGVIALLIVYYRIPLFGPRMVYLPLVVLIQLALTLGLGLAGAAFNVFYRDVKHLFALGLQLWLYATPIIYPVSLVPQRLRPFYSLNPMVGVIESYRAILLHGQPPSDYLFISALVSILVFIFGYWFFRRVEFQFADIV